jgi:hypothetical protein
VLKAVEIADDNYRAKPYSVWLGQAPFQQIVADLTDFVLNRGLGLQTAPDRIIEIS